MASAFEWLDSTGRISYPFEDHLDGGLKHVFVDGYVACCKALKDCRVRLSLFDSITGHVTLVYADGTTLYDLQAPTNCTYSYYDFGPAYRVHEWRRTDSDDDVVVRFTVNRTLIAGMEPIAVADAWLLRTLIDQRAPMVRRLGMKLPGIPCCVGGGIEDGCFILRAGYNMKLAVSNVTTGVRDKTVISIDAVPGAGLGQYPGCGTSEDGLRSIGGQVPDAFGNLNLEGDDCLWLERPLATPGYAPPPGVPVDYEATVEEHTLKLRDDCKACCDRADYGAAYQALRDTWLRLRGAAQSVEITRKKYNNLVAQTKHIYCDQGFVAMMRTFERPDYMVSVGISVAVRSDQPVTGLRIFIYATPSEMDLASYIPGSGYLEISQPGGEPVRVYQDLGPIKTLTYPVPTEDGDPTPDTPAAGITGMSTYIASIPAGGTMRYYFTLRLMTGLDVKIKPTFNAQFLDNPDQSGKQYTRLYSAGETFESDGILPDDIIKVWYGSTEVQYHVDEVLSNTNIQMLDGPSVQVLVPKPAEIWRNTRHIVEFTLTANLSCNLGSVTLSEAITTKAPKGKV